MRGLVLDDDLLCDVFVDKLELKGSAVTHKISRTYSASALDASLVRDLVTRMTASDGSVSRALTEFCGMDGVREHIADKTQSHLQAFKQHAKRYLEVFRPDSGIQLARTDRYERCSAKIKAQYNYGGRRRGAGPAPALSAVPPQAPPPGPSSATSSSATSSPPIADVAVIAQRAFKVGERIDGLVGALYTLTPEEDKALRQQAAVQRLGLKKSDEKDDLVRDFSVLWSMQKRRSQLVLGPARFINHDCNANAAFLPLQSSMAFTCVRPIQAGDEITCFYGPHYFESENAECMCPTCEGAGEGAFRRRRRTRKERLQQCSRKRRYYAIQNPDTPQGQNLKLQGIRRQKRKKARLQAAEGHPRCEKAGYCVVARLDPDKFGSLPCPKQMPYWMPTLDNIVVKPPTPSTSSSSNSTSTSTAFVPDFTPALQRHLD